MIYISSQHDIYMIYISSQHQCLPSNADSAVNICTRPFQFGMKGLGSSLNIVHKGLGSSLNIVHIFHGF